MNDRPVRIAAIGFLALALCGAAAAAEPELGSTLVAAAWSDSATAPWRVPAPVAIAPPAGGALLAASLSVGAGPLAGGYGSGRFDARLQLPLWAGVVGELRGGLLALESAAPADRRSMRSEVRLRAGEGPRQAWLGVAVEHDLSSERPPSGPLVVLGAATRARAVHLSTSVVQTVEPVRVTRLIQAIWPDTMNSSTTTVEYSAATSALLSGRWEHRRLALGTTGGVTVQSLTSPRWWSQVSASVALRPRLWVFATLGRPAPRWLVSGAGVNRGASVGLRLTSWVNEAAAGHAQREFQPSWRIRHLGDDWHVVEIRVRSARKVSVMGDFTDWQPLALRHLSGSRWALAVRMAPGVHQVQVSVDGADWRPPVGLSTSADGFNGAVGVFVAE